MKASKHALRMTAVILGVAILDCLWVLFAPKPLPGAALIPAMLPLLASIFVVIPMLKERKQPND